MVVGQSPFNGCDEDELFWSICNEQAYYPRFLAKETKGILVLLLEKDPQKRIGTPTCAAGEICDHPFFKTIDWDRLDRKDVEPPFKPKVVRTFSLDYHGCNRTRWKLFFDFIYWFSFALMVISQRWQTSIDPWQIALVETKWLGFNRLFMWFDSLDRIGIQLNLIFLHLFSLSFYQQRHILDVQYFDSAFTIEKPQLTPVDKDILASMDQAQFRGFSYTNPNTTDWIQHKNCSLRTLLLANPREKLPRQKSLGRRRSQIEDALSSHLFRNCVAGAASQFHRVNCESFVWPSDRFFESYSVVSSNQMVQWWSREELWIQDRNFHWRKKTKS